MSAIRGWPWWIAVTTLFLIVFLRAGVTFALARWGQHRLRASRRFGGVMHRPGYRRAERLVARWGAPFVVLSFVTIGLQTLVQLAAGASSMSLRRYIPALAVGSVLWAVVYATVGFVTLSAWQAMHDRLPVLTWAVTIGALVAAVLYVVRQLRPRVPTQG